MNQQQYDSSQFDPSLFDPSMSSNFDDMDNSGLSSDSFSSNDNMNSSFHNSTINLNSSYKSHNSANLSHHNNSSNNNNNNEREMNSTNINAAYVNAYGAGGDRLFMPLLNALMSIRAAEGNLQSPRGELQQICREAGLLNEEMLLGALQGVCELLGCYRLTTAISQVMTFLLS